MVIFCYFFSVFSILIATLSVVTLILLTLSPKYYWCSITCMYIFFNKYYKAYKEILALPGDLRLIHLDDVSFTNIKEGEIIYIYDDENKINSFCKRNSNGEICPHLIKADVFMPVFTHLCLMKHIPENLIPESRMSINEKYWQALTSDENKKLFGNNMDYFIYNQYEQQMEYWSASDCDAIIWKKQIVSKQEFLNRNLEKFILK